MVRLRSPFHFTPAWASLTILLCSPACHVSDGPHISEEPAFSKLAGRWTISLREMHKSFYGSTEKIDEFRTNERDRIVLVTINSDGSFDWPRTLLAVSKGIHDLRDKGDQCIGRRYRGGRYEVVACEYTPTRSFIEIRGLGEGIAQSSSRTVFDVQLQPDGIAIAKNVIDSTEHDCRLMRHDDPYWPLTRTQSRIAGHWAGSSDDPKILLIIRPDGTFDWTGTLEGIIGAMFQLERKGDRFATGMDPRMNSEVVSSRYAPDESRLKWTTRLAGRELGVQELVARKSDEGALAVTMTVEIAGHGNEHYKAVLHRIQGRTERVEGFTSELRKLSKKP